MSGPAALPIGAHQSMSTLQAGLQQSFGHDQIDGRAREDFETFADENASRLDEKTSGCSVSWLPMTSSLIPACRKLTAAPVRARRKPRDWPNEEKERLIAETLLPGANVSAIARAEGLDPSQLYGWRRKALSSGLVAPLTETAKKEVKFARVEPVASSAVKIVLGDVVVRVGGDIESDHLVKKLRAVRKA
ncbi:transposase-like protein [Sinorhizobium medicae]